MAAHCTLLVSPGASLSEDGAMTTDTRPAAAGTAPLDEVRATAAPDRRQHRVGHRGRG